MSLQIYLQNNWIAIHQTSRSEIANFLKIADRDFVESQVSGLGPEWRFDIAYNAALQLASAALAAEGFQPERQNKHQRTIECFAFTVKLKTSDVDFLNSCRRKRNTSVYDKIGEISHKEASEMLAFAQRLRTIVGQWLQRQHPELMK
jgi:uncharacterized protein (UPF0332 family)